MSVTFTSDKWQDATVICNYCEDYGGDCTVCNNKRYCTTRQPCGPSANFANTNAREVLAMLGLPSDDLYGEVANKDLGNVRQRILLVSNSERRQITRPAEQDGRCFVNGSTTEDVKRRLANLDAVLAWAQQNGTNVSWG